MADHPAQHKPEDHSSHLLLLGALGVAGATALAPYALPLVGIGDSVTTHRIMSFIGGEATPGFFGTGIAGSLQEAFSTLPFIGEALTSTAAVTIPGIGLTIASGALTAIIASTVIGVGGMMLARWMEKNEQPTDKIHWSKVIRTVSLATSILISLPSILTGISVGLTFLANLVDTQLGNKVAFAMSSDNGLGATSMALNSFSGNSLGSLAAIIPHLITCGGAIIPVIYALMSGKKPSLHASTRETAAGHSTSEAAFELVSCAMPAKDQPCQMMFRLRDPNTGQSLTPDTLETTFTKKFHLMLVDQTLGEYHHLHPTFDASTGLFTCQFTPNTTQPFTAWCDFTPKASGKAVRALANLPAMRSVCLPARISTASDVSAAGITAHVTSDAPLTMGKDSILRVELRDATGQPISNLGPVMGAYAHLAGFSADKQHFIHTHPITPLGAPIRNGTLEFHVAPEHAGLSKFFLQINHEGHEVFIPFGRVIAPNVSYRERVSAPSPSLHQHAMA